MGKHHSEEIKMEIVNKYFTSYYSMKNLEREYNISEKTIQHWINKYRTNGTVQNDINHTRGRKAEKDIDYKERYEILKKYQTFLKAQREKK